MPYFFFFCCWISVLGTVSAQDYESKLLQNIEHQTRWMEVDKMKHLYLVQDEHTILKYSADGELLFRYNENNLGQISVLDVTNSFRILVYYEDFNTVVFLDRTLSEIQRFDLSDFEIWQTQAIGLASDNNLWIFDNNSYTVKKIDNSGEVITESDDLTLFLSKAPNPNRIIEFNDRLYLNSPNLGIIVFDLYGTYIKTIEIPDLDYFQLHNGQIFYIQDKSIKSYHLLSFLEKKINLTLTKPNLEQLCIAQERLYLKYPNKTSIFRLKEK